MSATGPVREVVYTTEPAVWHPIALIRRMLRESWQFRELVRRVIWRNLRAQYRQSLLGYLWAFIPSVATAVGFSLAKDAQVIRVGETPIPYIAYVMVGTVLWQTFIESMTGPIDALRDFKGVLSHIYLPPEIIVLARIGEMLAQFLIKVVMLGIVFALYGVYPGLLILVAPLLLVLLIVQATVIGLILAPIGTLYHDILKGIPVVTGFWFLLTPVVYPVPEGNGIFATVVRLNPATYFLVATREALSGGTLSNPWFLVVAGILSVIGLVVAMIAFRVSIPFVVERAGE
jgi:lipopolysaccharide transport system permease protein